MAIKSGNHIGAVHNWIIWKCANGERVTWSSSDKLILRGEWTPAVLEEMAQGIADAVFNDIKKIAKVCDEFEVDTEHPFANKCIHCGFPKKLHEAQYGI